MRVGLAGFLHESNSFLSAPTRYEDFLATSLTRGPALLDRWRAATHELSGMIQGATDFEIVPLYATFAVPSGPIEATAFDRIAAEMIAAIRDAGPLDGLLIAVHGATVAENAPDADGEILARIREVVGAALPVVITFDLHANLSPRMIALSNAAIGYRTNPHLDQKERGLEAATLMGRILRGECRPVQALEMPPMLFQNSRQYTSQSPAEELYDDLREVLSWNGILSASVAMGFPHSDVEEMGASFLAVADGDMQLARKAAEWMARRAWDRRAAFAGPLPSVRESVERAAMATQLPLALMDVGDNVGGGSAANSTAIYSELERQGVLNGLIVIHDPAAVARCLEAGIRNEVSLEAGHPPVSIRGRVRTISDGQFEETQIRHGGWAKSDQGITVVVETANQHTVVLTSRRMAPFSLEQILSLGIHPERKRVLIVKGVIAPRAAYEVVAREFILVDSPGETADNPRNLPYKRRRHPLYPLEDEAEY